MEFKQLHVGGEAENQDRETRNERRSPERRASLRLRKQTCQTSVDLLDHKRRLFLHRSGSRFFINIRAKLAVSQAELDSWCQKGRLFSRLSGPPATLDTQNEKSILR